ncbi:hypothetical protein VC83_02380 [Pseudogymnoascus destructans]|uniref:Uncharacterized protein n=2 Tax=Pseudogymnoascus destructans TaxID=655981 RepID=L8FQK9_PSED2|nr:uncharacterized protein VC83_02380 [Pseudogymnoascus destructans]ELR03255.1 hypothetical protein GMDG_01238 [Pseudogymnoascus destructans 20631-21]OAF60862.1 hypothetical protein VC83_02380 [Pseudogymnoascus destructans]
MSAPPAEPVELPVAPPVEPESDIPVVRSFVRRRELQTGLRSTQKSLSGWIEQLEMSIDFKSDDGTVTNDHVFSVWSRTFVEAGEKFGKTFRIADLAREYIVGAGFDKVVEKKFGQWLS